MKSNLVPWRLALLPLLLAAFVAALPQEGGNRWAPIGPDGGGVSALSFAGNGRTVYAGTRAGGAFRSADNGRSWVRADRGLWGEVRDLAVDPDDPALAYAATSQGIFRTGNAGADWTRVNAGLPAAAARVGAFAVSTEPSTPGSVWAALNDSGLLYRSTDRGDTWRLASAGLTSRVLDVATHPTQGGVAVAATFNGLFRTRDSGRSWQRSGPKRYFARVVFDQVRPEHLYAVALKPNNLGVPFSVIFVSDNAGATWKPGGEAFISIGPAALVADPFHAGTAWAGGVGTAQFSVFKTTDGGLHWQGVKEGAGIHVLAANPRRAGVVLAGSESASFESSKQPAVFRSDDDGASWQPSDRGLPAQEARQVVADPASAGILYVRSGCCYLWKTQDGGRSWRRLVAREPELGITQLAMDPNDSSTLYLATGLNVFKSVDAGETWRGLASPSMDSITVDPAHPSTLYAAPGIFPVLMRSDDGGFSWRELAGTEGLYASLVMATPSAVYANGFPDHTFQQDELRRSTDGGATWSTILDLPVRDALITAVAEDPRNPQRLWVAFQELNANVRPRAGGIFSTTDGGAHWKLTRLAGNPPVVSLLLDSRRAGRIFAAAGVGAVFVSEDGGATWTSLSGGLPPARVVDLQATPLAPGTIYAATAGGSVYKLTRPEATRKSARGH